jgi:TonB family protein
VIEPPIRDASPPARPPALKPLSEGELHLLIGDLREDVAKYRRREAVWISLAVHGVAILLLIFVPKWIPSSPMIVPIQPKQQNAIFIDAPKTPKVTPPNSDKISDQDRTAQTRLPSRETMRKILDANPPGRPQPAAQPPQAAAPPVQAQQGQQAQPSSEAPAQQRTTETAKLDAPPPKNNPFAITSPGSSVDQAIRSAADRPARASTSFGSGAYGSGLHPRIDTAGNMEILSDTMGVDFGPYMKQLKVTVQNHWEPLIPEAALPPMMKKGRVVVEFAIMKDGTIQGMRMISGSGDVALDRAAWGALTYSIPLPRLPVQFSGDYLLIRAAFYYNPDKNDFE